LDSKHPLSCFGWFILYVRIILDFLTEIIVIRSLSHQISAQGISIRMSRTWLVHYLEVEVLQHINPSAPPTMNLRP
jgi:hypothetical protein